MTEPECGVRYRDEWQGYEKVVERFVGDIWKARNCVREKRPDNTSEHALIRRRVTRWEKVDE